LRCAKAKLCCGGYERAVVFVNRTPTNLFSEVKRESIQDVSSTVDQHKLGLQLFALQILTPSFPRLEFRQFALDLLRKTYLPRSHQPNGAPTLSRSAYSWLQSSCELEGRSEALDYSLLTFCVIQFHITERSSSREKALQLYTISLRKLCADIDDLLARERDETIAAIVVLSTCEVGASSDFSILQLL
jgi:hypothetical protein